MKGKTTKIMDIITSITSRIKYLSLILSCCKWINLHLPCSASTLLGLPLQRWGDCTKPLNPSYWFGRTTSVSGTSRFRILLGKAFSTSIAKSTFSKKERNSRSAKRIAIITEGTTFKREVKHLRGLKARNVFQGCARGGCKTSFFDLDVFFSFL